MNKEKIFAYCEVCEYKTQQVEVIMIDTRLDESWSEPKCRNCFESDIDWQDLYG